MEHDSATAAVHPSVAVYTPVRLALYDLLILGFSCRFVWRCPRRRFLELYDRHVGPRHLDVGLGTGYFIDRCRFPVERPAITLLDLSEACLTRAAERIARYSRRRGARTCSTHSTSACAVRLCRPERGPPLPPGHDGREGRGVAYIAEGGVLFGSTIPGNGVEHSFLARKALAVYNREGIFTNRGDDCERIERALVGSFSRHQIETEGSFALFAAWP